MFDKALELKNRVLLHICCSPDATYPLIYLRKEGFIVYGFFYGSNIQPYKEYKKRLKALLRLKKFYNFALFVNPYNPDRWFDLIAGFEKEPEGGKRCRLCFEIQLEETAKVALSLNISFFTTTLTISPHKDVEFISDLGKVIAKKYGLNYLSYVFRKNSGFIKSVNISKKLRLYRQNYCGCQFSLRGSDKIGR